MLRHHWSVQGITMKTVIWMAPLAISGMWVAAAQAAENSRDVEDLDTVTVTAQQERGYLLNSASTATGLDMDVRHTPQSMSVVSRTQLDDFALLNINDVLANSAGVTVEKPETDRVYYTSRGFNVTNFQSDGVGMPLTHNNVYGDIDTAIYERVEILRGANALRAGLGDPSATVNLIRKRPGAENGGQVSLSGGSWGTYRLQADASARGNLDTSAGRVVVAEQDGDSYLDRYGLKKRIAYGVFEQQLDDASTLTLGLNQQWSWADSPLWGALPMYNSDGEQLEYDVSTSSAADWSFFNTRTRQAFAELNHGFDNGWSLKATYSYSYAATDSHLFYVAGVPDADTGAGVKGAYSSEYNFRESHRVGDLLLSGPFRLAGRSHEFMAGVNVAKVRVADESIYDVATVTGAGPDIDVPTFDGDYAKPVFNVPGGGGFWNDKQRAFYSAARFSLTDTVNVIAGGRVTNWKSEGSSYGKDRSNSHNNVVTPYLGLTWDVLDAVTVYGSWTETFAPQTEMDIDGDRLDPKQSVNYELGVKTENAAKTLRGSVAVFRSLQDNVAVATGEKVPGTTKDAYRGDDGVKTLGYEAELVGSPMERLELSLSYTDLEIRDADNELTQTFIPQKMARASASWRVSGLEQLKLGSSISWQDDVSREQGVVAAGDNAGQTIITRQSAYTLVNLMASYDISKQLSASFNVKNLTNEKYLNSLYWPQAYYAAPRNYMASVNWKF